MVHMKMLQSCSPIETMLLGAVILEGRACGRVDLTLQVGTSRGRGEGR